MKNSFNQIFPHHTTEEIFPKNKKHDSEFPLVENLTKLSLPRSFLSRGNSLSSRLSGVLDVCEIRRHDQRCYRHLMNNRRVGFKQNSRFIKPQ